MAAAETLPEERVFRYPSRSRWTYIAVAVFGGSLAAAAVALQFAAAVDPIERLQLSIFALVFAALLVHALDAVRTMSRELRIGPDGVGTGTMLQPWSDVVRIEIRPLRQRMDLLDPGGRRILSLRPELESFPVAQDYIIGHMQPRPCAPPCTIPLLAPFAGAPIAVISALLAVWSGPERAAAAAILAGLSLVLAGAQLARRSSIRVGTEQLVLRRGLRRVRVPYRDITAVHVQARPWAHGGAVHFVVLQRGGEESIPIAGFRRGYREAFQCIESAWRAGTSALSHSAAARG